LTFVFMPIYLPLLSRNSEFSLIDAHIQHQPPSFEMRNSINFLFNVLKID